MQWSRSQISTVKSVAEVSASAYCAANEESSPIGEYYLNITSPPELVYISSGSPSRILIVLLISFGITTRPKSSILRTIPVAFILYNNLPCLNNWKPKVPFLILIHFRNFFNDISIICKHWRFILNINFYSTENILISFAEFYCTIFCD